MRRIPALVSSVALVTVLAASLVGCSSSGFEDCAPQVVSGNASKLVRAPGESGTKPTVSVPAPLVVHAPQRTVLQEGTGSPIPKGGVADFEASIVDGATGTVLLQTAYDPSSNLPVRGVAGREGALYQSFTCARVGDRISIVTPMGVSGVDTSSVGISDPNATIVFVIDVVASYLGKANGVNQLPQDGMPNVVTAPDGTPGITVPAGGPPAKTRIATIKAGGGVKVAENDHVVAHVSAWVWPKTGTELTSVDSMSSWDANPFTLPVVVDPTTQTGVTKGIFDALRGATVGSQLLAVVAPADSYADGSWPTGTAAGDTVIYVIDVLGIQKPLEK